MDIMNEILAHIEANKEAMKAKEGWVVVDDCFNPNIWTPVSSMRTVTKPTGSMMPQSSILPKKHVISGPTLAVMLHLQNTVCAVAVNSN